MTITENNQSNLRYEVHGQMFGRKTLIAAFLTHELAEAWMSTTSAKVFA